MTYAEKAAGRLPAVSRIPFGGDYNPEQWPEEVWDEDMRLFKLAGVNCVTLNVFSWAALEPQEGMYSFSRLDKIMDMMEENGFSVILATSTGAHPAWMAKKYPEVLRTEFNGMRRKFGGRHNSCPNSPIFRKRSRALARELARRYGRRRNLIAWHVGNEYGGECYCENCERAFRRWLQAKYGNLEALNRAWNTSFWGHTFYDWEEIVVPNLLSEHFTEDRTMFQGISLDYRRFMSDSILECFLGEREAIKETSADIPVTTNLMGFYKPLDYQKWARYMDFISWDNYPENDTPPSRIAMAHDLMRGIKAGQPFYLMEQTPSVSNWLSYNALKRPGVMRLLSYQAMAHGADSVLFFQMRRSTGACEKYHGALIDHVGNENTRVFREMQALGAEIEALGDRILGARTPAKAAIVVDWDNWWALEYSAGPSCDLKYLDEVERYYRAFFELNIPVDIVSVEDELDRYKMVVAPVLYMVKTGAGKEAGSRAGGRQTVCKAPKGFDEKLRRYVLSGGTLVTTFFSGIVEEHDLAVTGGYPGHLRDILGIWVEEIDALAQGQKNSFTWQGKSYEASLLCDILHLETARGLAFYETDFYAGFPVLTCNSFGEGKAYYVATRGEREFYRDFVAHTAAEAGVSGVWNFVEGMEIAERQKAGERFLFFLNHNMESMKLVMEVDGKNLLDGRSWRKGETVELEGKGVMVLQSSAPPKS